MTKEILTYEEEMFILGIYNSGIHKMIDLVTKTGKNDATIRDVLKKYGRKVSRTHTRITDEHIRKAKELRMQGASYTEIAVSLHIGISTVKRILDREAPRSENQYKLPICNEIKAIPIEALRMLRDALDMIIEAREDT